MNCADIVSETESRSAITLSLTVDRSLLTCRSNQPSNISLLVVVIASSALCMEDFNRSVASDDNVPSRFAFSDYQLAI